MTCSQPVHGFRQPIRGCSAPHLNWRDGWFWLSGWVSHGECTSVCMVTHWIGPTVGHNLRQSSSHDLNKLFHCVVSQPWENIELVLKLAMTLTYGWYHKLIIYSLWIGPLLMEAGSNYSQLRHYDISSDWNSVSHWVILRRYVHGNYGHSSSLSGTWHRFFDS